MKNGRKAEPSCLLRHRPIPMGRTAQFGLSQSSISEVCFVRDGWTSMTGIDKTDGKNSKFISCACLAWIV